MPWPEIVLVSGTCVPIPGTHQLTVVAPVNAVAYRFAEHRGNRAARLDGEIRNAATGVELIGGNNRLSRTNIDAGSTGTAMRCDGFVHRQGYVGKYFTQKKVGSVLAIQDVRVLTD